MSFRESLDELTAVLGASRALEASVRIAGEVILESLQSGGQLLTCGNGGSAADALHLTEELVGCYQRKRQALRAVCLNADVAALTCIANDYGYDHVFARQVEGLGRAGDVLVGFTTSGNSPNVLAAFEVARVGGVTTILLGGKGGGEAAGRCDHEIIVPSNTTSRIQELHTVILHQWLERIDVEVAENPVR